MVWLDIQMTKEKISLNDIWNDYLNNYICFYSIIELYITLCYSIKYSNLDLLKYAMKEIYIILQAPTV